MLRVIKKALPEDVTEYYNERALKVAMQIRDEYISSGRQHLLGKEHPSFFRPDIFQWLRGEPIPMPNGGGQGAAKETND